MAYQGRRGLIVVCGRLGRLGAAGVLHVRRVDGEDHHDLAAAWRQASYHPFALTSRYGFYDWDIAGPSSREWDLAFCAPAKVRGMAKRPPTPSGLQVG
jgi:hypothetical protein